MNNYGLPQLALLYINSCRANAPIPIIHWEEGLGREHQFKMCQLVTIKLCWNECTAGRKLHSGASFLCLLAIPMYIVCTPLPPLSSGGGGIEPPTKFSKWGGGLDRTSTLKGGCSKRGGNFFRRGCNFYKKNQLKSETNI